MRKFSHKGNEIRNMDDRIDSGDIKSFLNIYNEYDKPSNPYSVRVHLFTCESDYSSFKLFPYNLIDCGFVYTDIRITISEFKLNLIEELKKKINYDKALDKFLIREYKLEKPTKVS